jgi:hypothetical protein
MLFPLALAAADVAAPAAEGPATTVRAAAPPPSRPRRVEIIAAVGLSGGGSRWAGDGLGYGSLLLGVRLFRAVAPFGEVRLGYAGVDQRLLTLLSVGLQGGYPIKVGGRDRLWPYARVGFVHQHEESLAAVAENAFGTLLGIGNAIRHRAGVQAAVGLDVMLYQGRRAELVLGPQVMIAYLGYSSGPDLYGTAGVQLGGSVGLF